MESHHVVYPWRWVMLFIIFSLNFSNATLWVSFAPIAPYTMWYYGLTSTQAFNMLSNIFMIGYIPLGFFSQWFLDHKSFKWGLLLGAWLNMLGAWLRYGSVFIRSSQIGTLTMLYGGQLLAAFAQPFVLNSPPKMALLWFSTEGRATADMVGTIGNVLGLGVGQVLSSSLTPAWTLPLGNITHINTTTILANSVVNNHTNGTGGFPGPSMELMLLVYACMATGIGLFATLFVREKPPTPPSASAAETADSFIEGLKACFRNPPYIILLLTFGIGLGVFNVMTSLLGQIVFAVGFSENDSAIFGLILIGVGLVTAGVVAPILDYSHKYKEIYTVAFILATCAAVGLALALQYKPTFTLIGSALGVMGVGAFMILPTALELCVEITHPVAPVTSAGFMWMSGQIIGIITLFAAGALVDPVTKSYQKAVWMMTGLIVFGMTTTLSLLCLKPRYKRLEVEQKEGLLYEETVN
eukprot:TRINITY_DN5573_c0_g1_i1.p1 TRINITY_DN5573_c0_g1~~TRINITY_DN5573_c0_g1_i1.p1  ORF type:complete len:468 (-),score=64.07 TRINITY_DN5573_c0_g1_i1:33-1436(-)